MTCPIPIVDISSWLVDGLNLSLTKKQQHVAAEWREAMKEFGCAVLVGHGVSEEQFESINAECREFFGKSYEEKQTYNNGIYGNPLGGYTAPGNEIVALSNGDSVDMYGAQGTSERKTKFDPVENFVFTAHPLKYTSSLGQSAPFRSVCDYYEAMDALLKTIHKLSCGALGVADLDYFNKFYDPTLPGNENLGINGNALRLAHYPPINPVALHASTDSAGAFDDQVRYGAHTDYQGFTILRPDRSDWHCLDVQVQEPTSTSASSGSSRVLRVQCGGLEVFHRASGQWLQVCIPPHLNALVVNAGDLIQRWTNDYWHSPLHRVVTSRAAAPGVTADALAPSGVTPREVNSSSTDSSSGSSTTTTTAAAAETDVIQCASVASRQAIVFFTGPLEDCLVESLDPALMRNVDSREVAACRSYPPIRSGDHLLMKLNRTNLSDA